MSPPSPPPVVGEGGVRSGISPLAIPPGRAWSPGPRAPPPWLKGVGLVVRYPGAAAGAGLLNAGERVFAFFVS